MEISVKTISIDRDTKEVLSEINNYEKMSNDPWDKFFNLMGDELIKRKEVQAVNPINI